MEPMAYEFSGDYTFQIKLDGRVQQVSGTGIASLQIVDDPPAGF